MNVLSLLVPRAPHEFEPEPDEEVVRVCRELLERAESGKVVGVAIATVLPEGGTGSTFALGRGTLAPLIGALMQLVHRMAAL